MKSEIYLEQLKKCLHKSKIDPQNKVGWLEAASVYRHLLKCKRPHSALNGGVICDWEPWEDQGPSENSAPSALNKR